MPHQRIPGRTRHQEDKGGWETHAGCKSNLFYSVLVNSQVDPVLWSVTMKTASHLLCLGGKSRTEKVPFPTPGHPYLTSISDRWFL